MSDQLLVCEGCDRHVRADDARCPFCQTATARQARATAARAAAAACLAVAAGLSLQACYGGPPRPRSYAYEQHRPGGAALQVAADPGQTEPTAAQGTEGK